MNFVASISNEEFISMNLKDLKSQYVIFSFTCMICTYYSPFVKCYMIEKIDELM